MGNASGTENENPPPSDGGKRGGGGISDTQTNGRDGSEDGSNLDILIEHARGAGGGQIAPFRRRGN
eukprot:CAMPEP_0113900500 /NCGR_PEP_ID=MMETSP0780_2-20120614/20711_1 /TAXON_ID=652834 /ORGANISM="Palpitomonas bilix" /LENGTH=65 /DNA_ID=CAMNT_0000892965 /DNA_START=179 /DNA_END=376 /DNA_ORIENTATION=- /assembly_acc=CAM_ASM_000599